MMLTFDSDELAVENAGLRSNLSPPFMSSDEENFLTIEMKRKSLGVVLLKGRDGSAFLSSKLKDCELNIREYIPVGAKIAKLNGNETKSFADPLHAIASASRLS